MERRVGCAWGAAGSMSKPWRPRELVAGVHAIVRRMVRRLVFPCTGQTVATRTTIGDIELDASSRRVRRAGEEVHLTPTEWRVVAEGAQNPGQDGRQHELLSAAGGRNISREPP